ncbi:MAG: DUF3617 family protein [Pseudomonadota bacterium]
MDTRIAALLCLCFSGTVYAQETILPGLYQLTITTEMQMGDMQMPGQRIEEQHCLTAEDVANGPPVPEPGDAACETTEYEFGAGKFRMAMTCRMPEGEGQMTGTGTYSDERYEMENHFKMRAQGLDMQMRSKAIGERLRDC